MIEFKAELILENIIKNYLIRGIVPTIEDITREFNDALEGVDLSLTDLNSFLLEENEISSAIKFNTNQKQIRDDLNVIFKSLRSLSAKSVRLFEKWDTQTKALEHRLDALNNRMDSLLLLTEDSSGALNTVGDDFNNLNRVDLTNSNNIFINLNHGLVGLDPFNTSNKTKIFLDNLTDQNIIFNVLNKNSVVNISTVSNNKPVFTLHGNNRFWQTRVATSRFVAPLNAELVITFPNIIDISKIDLELNTSNIHTEISVLYSSDGINYQQVPSLNPIISTSQKAEFLFSTVSCKKIKVFFQRNSYDYIASDNTYVYEFGAKFINFYKEGFSSDPENKGIFKSLPLSSVNIEGNKAQFSKVSLEVCEGIHEDTTIDYFVAAGREVNGEVRWITPTGLSANFIVGGIDQRLWYAITPFNRTNNNYTKVVDFGKVNNLVVSDIGISYDPNAENLVSPAQEFSIIDIEDNQILSLSASNLESMSFTQEEKRYILPYNNKVILDTQIKQDINLDTNNIMLWRNIGEKGITPGDLTKHVRGTQIGWEFKDPYYTTTILLQTPFTIDIGEQVLSVNSTPLRGVVTLPPGVHTIKVHKLNWKEIPPGFNTLAELRQSDVLYPYNHKLLIEGYRYGSLFEENEVYVGVDLFASYLLDEISVFDFLNNNNLSVFSYDTDSPQTSELADTSSAPLSYVFLVNIYSDQTDFMNERFMLSFNLTDELLDHVALKAEFKTENNTITPILSDYRIKLI